MVTLQEITEKIRHFRDERDWAQFHNPKDMAMALSIEAGELMEHFLWKSPDEVAARLVEKREEIEEEVADVAIYLVELADILGIDLFDAISQRTGQPIGSPSLRHGAFNRRGGSTRQWQDLQMGLPFPIYLPVSENAARLGRVLRNLLA